VRIEPHLGALKTAEGTVPHPAGLIRVRFTRTADRLHARIELPGELTGALHWQGRTLPLKPGVQELDL